MIRENLIMALPSDKFDQRPYLNLIEDLGPIRIFEVDGKWVRKHLNREMTNWAQGKDPRFKEVIPQNEFWVDTGFNPDELQFFIDNMLTQWYLLGRGYSREYAEREGTKVETRERQNARLERGEYKDPHIDPKIKLLKRVSDIEIWLVDGKKIRDHIMPQFTAGGHYLCYPAFIKPKEIWIDNTLIMNDWKFAILHEIHEHNNMQIGKIYKEAHSLASRAEWQCRHDPQELLRQQKQLGLI
jgi:hypothetical protein